MHHLRWPILALTLLCAAPALGLQPRLVKDINPTPFPEGSEPASMVTAGSLTYFAADDGESGYELWRTDGTEAGTFQILDICPGACSGGSFPVAAVGDLYFFTAFENEHGISLWVTEGTAAATFRLTDGIGVLGTPGRRALWVSGALYFVASDGVHGDELWRTDGTAAGTFLVADLRPGPQGSGPGELTEFGGRLYFRANNGVSGPALWKSDGTARGTQLVRDPVPSSADHAGPSLLRAVGKHLFFAAPAPRGGVTQLWRSDGTTRGTTTLTNLKPGVSPSTVVSDATVLGSRLLFATETAAGQELWATDGTPKGTRALTGFANPFAFTIGGGRLALPQTTVGNQIMFRADDGVHGIELWTTDGTPKGTRMVKDFCPGSCSGAGGGIAVGRKWYLSAGNATRGFEAWVTDGTASGTRMLRDICRGACSSAPRSFFAVGERVFFLAQSNPNDVELFQLWRTDGTIRSTVQLTNIERNGYAPFADPFVRSSAGGAFVFAAADPEHGREVWRSDGTVQGTRVIADINRGDRGGSFPVEFMSAGGQLFFIANGGLQAFGIWRSDGTEAGTRFISNPSASDFHAPQIYSSAEAGNRLVFSFPATLSPDTLLWSSDGAAQGTLSLLPEGVNVRSNLRTVGDKVFFVAGDPVHGEELWITDGTPEGTRLVVDLVAGDDRPHITGLTAFKSRLYFWAQGEGQGTTLWTSDGTAAGTVAIGDPNRFSRDADLLVEHAGRLWFFASDHATNRSGLWSTDGTTAGTQLAADFLVDLGRFSPTQLVSAGSRLFFAGDFSGEPSRLWVTDGTTAGTRRVGSGLIQPGQEMLSFGGDLYYRSLDTNSLWKSDGTEEGTAELRDEAGQPILLPFASDPSGLRVVAGRLYVVDRNGSLYQSDGTPAGTSVLLDEVGPELLPVGNRLFFSHRDRATGTELWVLE